MKQEILTVVNRKENTGQRLKIKRDFSSGAKWAREIFAYCQTNSYNPTVFFYPRGKNVLRFGEVDNGSYPTKHS
jgi:hypothetical protein